MSSVSGWSEGALFSLLFIAVMAIIVSNFNLMYNQDNALPFTDNAGTTTAFIESQQTANEQIQGGEALFDAQQGITLKSSWGIAKDTLYITWGFVTGGWIEQTIGSMGLGDSAVVLALYLRILYVASLISAILYVLFKVVV